MPISTDDSRPSCRSIRWGHSAASQQIVALLNYDLGRYAAMSSTLNYAHVDLLKLPEALSSVDLDLDFHWDVAP